MVENSWGSASGYRGHLIMTDKWFDEYMFRVVAEKKYVPAKVLDIFKTETKSVFRHGTRTVLLTKNKRYLFTLYII